MKRLAHLLAKLPPWANTIAVAIVIALLTLSPAPSEQLPPMFPGADKVVHAIMFWALASAAVFDLMRRSRRAKPSLAALAVILCLAAVYGQAIELLQEAMAMGRGRELLDLAADTAGAAIAVATTPAIVRYLLS